MTDESRTLTPTPDDLGLLIGALTSMPGALSEVATVWRRLRRSEPDLPLGVPLRLEGSVRHLKQMIEDLRWAGAREWPALMLEVINQLAILDAGIAAASALTSSPGRPPAGDAGLWAYLHAAMNQARLHTLALMLVPPVDINRPMGGPHAPAPAAVARPALPRPQ